MLISVGDVRLFVDVDGAKLVPDGMSMRERPTIILIHGGPGFDHTPFKAHYSPPTEIAQVVYYDHRGNGRSDEGPRERWNLNQWADDLRTLCDVLGIERPIVFGASFGGCERSSKTAAPDEHLCGVALFLGVPLGAMAASDGRRVRTDMEQWSEIRRKVLVEGVSKRQVCREYGLGWRTLEKMLGFPEPPGYRRQVPRGRPRLGPFVGLIDGILAADAAPSTPRKQRHTARRIYE